MSQWTWEYVPDTASGLIPPAQGGWRRLRVDGSTGAGSCLSCLLVNRGRRGITDDREEITSLVTALGDLIQVLRDADPADKAEVYSQLGLTLTYHPEDKRVIAEARPETIMYVGKCPRGDLNPHALYGH